jgi:hypothetical protein
MTMQFTWQGCDSFLAAPLVLDLARLALLAQRRGEVGVLRHLACFFKSPLGVTEQDFFKQFALLEDYVRAAGVADRKPPGWSPAAAKSPDERGAGAAVTSLSGDEVPAVRERP